MDSRRPRDDSRRKRRRPKPKKSGSTAIIIAASIAGAVVVGFVAVVLIMQVAKSRRTDPRLFGTWKSDADATIAEMKKTRTLADDAEHKLKTVLFGKMKITYTATTVTTDFEGTVESQSYKVVGKDADSVSIKAWSPLTQKDETFRIRFDGPDTYWVEADVPTGKFRECFRRVN
jgi:hypothetical protein